MLAQKDVSFYRAGIMRILKYPPSFVFLVTARKQVVTQHQAGNNNQNSKQTVAHKEHNAHTDTNPE